MTISRGHSSLPAKIIVVDSQNICLEPSGFKEAKVPPCMVVCYLKSPSLQEQDYSSAVPSKTIG